MCCYFLQYRSLSLYDDVSRQRPVPLRWSRASHVYGIANRNLGQLGRDFTDKYQRMRILSRGKSFKMFATGLHVTFPIRFLLVVSHHSHFSLGLRVGQRPSFVLLQKLHGPRMGRRVPFDRLGSCRLVRDAYSSHRHCFYKF